MSVVDLDYDALTRWRADPLAFIEYVLCDPESGRPFALSDAERQFLERAFQLDDNGRLKFPEMCFGAIKKSGKTTLAAIIMLTMVLLYGGPRFAEGYCIANDYDQAANLLAGEANRRGVAAAQARGQADGRPCHVPGARCDHHGDRERRC